ncbi:MAG: gluconate 2-dehydrogenase subunit 3 family protein [Burkholderiales bacterium]
MEESSGRRRFLKSSVGALGVAAVPATVVSNPASSAEAHAHQGNVKDQGNANAEKYMFFSAAEVAFVDAAVARLIPADELGPGAKEAGVTYFIDQQLFGGWGTMAKMYRQGPHAEGTPQQGYQSPLTPQEIFRVAIREINHRLGKPFEKLAPKEQDEALKNLEEGKLALDAVPSRFFFNMLLDSTIEGFFSDPIYGGNRGKVGWKLVGFPGVAAAYTTLIDKHGVPYAAEPVSIVDMLEGRVAADEHGHPKHVILTRKD